MTIHKLSAGSGYEYLTRKVAALDSTEKGATPLADYYSAKGESPGRWAGSGLVGIAGLEAGAVVTAEQMKHRLASDHGRAAREGVQGLRQDRRRRVQGRGRPAGEGRRGFDQLNRREAAGLVAATSEFSGLPLRVSIQS